MSGNVTRVKIKTMISLWNYRFFFIKLWRYHNSQLSNWSTLDNTEGAIEKGQSRETGNIGCTRRRQVKQKHNTIYNQWLLMRWIQGFINPGILSLPRPDGRGKYISRGLINPGIHRFESH